MTRLARTCATTIACAVFLAANAAFATIPYGVHRNLERGDPTAIATIVHYLTLANKPAKFARSSAGTNLAAKLAGEARLRGLRGLLIELCGKTTDTEFRFVAVNAIATIGDPDTAPFLEQAVADHTLERFARCAAAVALLDIVDSPPARKLLLEEVRFAAAPDARESRFTLYLPPCYDRLSDPGVASGVRDVAVRQRDRTTRERLNYLAEQIDSNARLLRLNQQQLLAIAQDPRKERQYRRYRAIELLGERGSPNAIDTLVNLEPWSGLPDRGELDRLRFAGERMAGLIQLRHSKEAIELDAGRDPMVGHAPGLPRRAPTKSGITIIRRAAKP